MATHYAYKTKEKLEGEAHDQEEFHHCEHVDDITNYCHQCKLFACDDCSEDHLEHLEDLDAWDSLVKEYLIRCNNCDSRLKMILKILGIGNSNRTEIISKLDACFDDIHKKIDEYKEKVRKEILEKMPKEEGKSVDILDKSECKPEIVKKYIRELESLMKNMEYHMGRDEKKEMIDLMKKDVLKEVEGNEYFKNLDLRGLASISPKKEPSFWIRHLFTKYEDFLPFIESNPDIQRRREGNTMNTMNTMNIMKSMNKTEYQNVAGKAKESAVIARTPMGKKGGVIRNVTDDYFWFVDGDGVGQRTWKKNNLEQSAKSYSYCSSTPLPEAFSVTFLIKNFVQDTFGVFGVSKTNFGIKRGWLTWANDQFAFCTDGHAHSYTQDIQEKGNPGFVYEIVGQKYVQTHIKGTKTGDLFELCLNKDKKLSMIHNGKHMVDVFTNVEGPFFICGSMYYENSEVEITEVWDITDA